ncbi:M48 family metalloprotease [Nibribacter ruber]|uniref:M48 family metalloprotease n=1 Tax=Nibribacter ruber TaxID=2698458 RepID=A0A6P1NZE0_9BACT|nr:M48 family metalloprotease [Nibribacter ruber]QHL85912.1 M48 family metalloprotease [Nibribacter ruber]
MKKNIFYSSALAVLLLFNSCATNPVTGKKEVMLISEEQEIAMGQEADPQIVAQFGLYNDPEMQRFIQEKGQQMAAVSHRSNLKYTFRVLDSEVINAFAVPGGYVYFTRGIMAHLNNEAQFAGVLGHEIGHVTARHSAAQQSKATLTQGLLIGGMIFSPTLANMGQTLSQGASLLFLKFGRDAERQSDELGVEYSTKIGYDATEMADFFLTLQRSSAQAGAQEIPDFLSTHPNPGDRYSTVKQLAAQWKQQVNTPLKVNRNNFLKLIDGIIYGEDPKQGFVENQVFYHPELKFQFPIPQAWQYQNTPQQVQMAPKDGKALMFLTLVPGTALEAAAQEVVTKYQLQPLESRSVTVNGLPAIAIVADQKPSQEAQQQQQEQVPVRAMIYLIQYGGNIYGMFGVTSANDFNAYAPTFSNTMQNFRTLSDPDKLNRQPERVRVKTLSKASTLAQALTSYNVPTKRQEEIAILNGMQLKDQLAAGTMIKIVAK